MAKAMLDPLEDSGSDEEGKFVSPDRDEKNLDKSELQSSKPKQADPKEEKKAE